MKSRYSKILSILFFILSVSCHFLLAQTDSSALSTRKKYLADSLRQKQKADSLKIYRFQKLRPYFSFDNRNSFIRNAPISIYGLQAGVILNERHTLGIGGYTISKESKRPVKVKGETVESLRDLKLNYLTFFYQYALLDKRFFELDIPVE